MCHWSTVVAADEPVDISPRWVLARGPAPTLAVFGYVANDVVPLSAMSRQPPPAIGSAAHAPLCAASNRRFASVLTHWSDR
jgi:hypothetical protein